MSVQSKRAAALDAAYTCHPERFVRHAPRPPALPPVVSINPVVEDEEAAGGVNFPTLAKVRGNYSGFSA